MFSFIRRRNVADEPHPDDWVTRVFARFEAEPDAASIDPGDWSAASLFAVLEARRRELGLSKAEAVRRALGPEASPTVWQNIQRGKSPRCETVAALASALGLELRLDPRPSPVSAPDFGWLDTPEALAERIKAACAAAGVSEAKLSREVGGHSTVVTDLRKGRWPGLRKLMGIARFLGLELYLGPPRVSAMRSAPAQDAPPDLRALIRARLDELGLNMFRAERELGLPSDAIRSVLREDRPLEPSWSRAHMICAALGIELRLGAAPSDPIHPSQEDAE